MEQEAKITPEQIDIVNKQIKLNQRRYEWLVRQLGWYYNSTIDMDLQAEGWQPGVKVAYDPAVHGKDWYNFELNSEYCWYQNEEIKTQKEFEEALAKAVKNYE